MTKNLLLTTFIALIINFQVHGQGTTQQRITFQAISNKTIGDPSFSLVATAESGLPVTFTVTSGSGIASVSGSTVTLSNTQAGTVTVQADQAGNSSFAAATPVSRTFTVAKRSNAITFAAIANKTYGDSNFTLSGSASSGLPVTYTITGGSDIASLSGSTVSLSGTAFGTVTIVASQAGSDVVATAIPVTRTFKVSKLSNTLTFSTISNKTYGDGDFSLSATASSGLPVTYTVTNGSDIVNVTGNTVSLSGTAFGTVTIVASQAGNDTIAAATSVTRSFLVSKSSNVITFPTIPNKTYGDSNFMLAATSSSGLPVTYTISSGSSIASVSGSTVLLSGTAFGTVTVVASQAGNATVATATSVTRSFIVSKLPNTITFPSIANKTYGDSDFSLGATSSTGLPVSYTITSGSSIASVTGSTVSLSGTAFGTVTVVASQAGNDTIAAASSVTKSFTVSKLSNTLTFAAIPNKTYGDSNFSLSATSSSGLPVTYTVTGGSSIASISGNTVSLSGIAFGTVTIVASQAGNDTVVAAASITRTFTVSKSSNVITFPAITNKTYGAADFPLSATASSGLPVTYTVTNGSGIVSISGGTASLTGTTFGTVTIVASQAGNDTIAAATSVTRTFTVTKSSNVITFPTIPNKTYGDSDFMLSATASSGLPITYTVTSGSSIVSVTGSTVSLSGTAFGTVTIVASQSGNDTIAAATSVSKSFTVSKSSNVITFPTISNKTYGDASFSLGATASSGLPVTYTITSGGTIASVSGSTVSLSGTAFGTVTIVASQAGNATVGAASSVTRSFTVSKLSNVITFASIPSKTYGDSDFSLSGSASSGLPVTYTITSGGTIASITGSTVSLSGTAFGTVTIVASQAGDDTTAAATSVTRTFTVSKSSNVITFPTIPNKVYGDSDFALGATASSGLPVTYTVTSGSSIVSLTGNMVSLSGTAFGTVTIVASQAGSATVAAATSVTKTFTVSKSANVITFTTIPNKTYGDAAFALGATASSGLPVTYTVTSGSSIASVAGNMVTLSGTAFGTVTIVASQAGNATIATAASVTRSFTVSKLSNVITFATIPNKVYGDSDFILSASSSSGLPITYTVTNGSSIASVTGNTVSLSGTAFGTVTIVASQAGNDTVATASSITKSFTVSKASQTVTWAAVSSKITTDGPFAVSATASSGLAVTYSVLSGPATVSGNMVTLTGSVGTVKLKATQAGNTNYNAASSTVTFTVTSAPAFNPDGVTSAQEIDFISTGISLYPNPSNGVINISSDKMLKSVNIYNSLGSLVFTDTFKNTSSEHRLNLNNLSKGFYIVVLTTNDNNVLKNRFIIE